MRSFLSGHSGADRRSWRTAAATVLAAAGWLTLATDSHALVQKTWDGTNVMINREAPTDDPGWNNTSGNISSIYLGNQWVLTAKHVGTQGVELPSGFYPRVNNTTVTLTNPSSYLGRSLSSQSDLIMYRIGTHSETGLTPEEMDPDVRTIEIASTAPNVDDEVLMFGAGRPRSINLSDPNGQWHWNVSGGSLVSTSSQTADEHGFMTVGDLSIKRKMWGTNRVANASTVPGATDNGKQLVVKISGNNDVVGLVTQFDRGLDDTGQPIEDGSTEFEAQGTANDSGGPVFFKDSAGDWVLGGVMHAIYLKDYQAGNQVLFETHTAFSDLSFSHYRTQIEGLRASSLYSVLGDVDLDGQVTGSIVNGEATGDLAALVDGWLMDQESPDVHSWMRGDLNQDGLTDLSDFVLLRDALGGSVSASSFATLVNGVSVPEPSAVLLTLVGLAGLGGRGRRRSAA